jgi:outer membrane immunogenic protein
MWGLRMRHLSVAAISAVAILVFTQFAFAAPPPPPTSYSWTGCYVGVNVGGIGGNDKYDLSIGGGFLVPPNLAAIPANQAAYAHSYAPNEWGFTGGGQVGCNYQMGTWVVGIEGDFNGSSLHQSVNATYGPFQLPVGPVGPLVSSHTEAVTNDIDWFATVRGRLGYTWGNVLLYATGGLAVAEIKSSTNVVFLNDQFFLPTANFAGSATNTRTGWTVGGGFEWMFNPHWTVKAEYLYLDFGSFAYSALCPSTNASCQPANGPALWDTKITTRANVARLGVNYKF